MAFPAVYARRIVRTAARSLAAGLVLAGCSAPPKPTVPRIAEVRVPPFRIRGAVEQPEFVGAAISKALKRNLEMLPDLRVAADATSGGNGVADLVGTFRRDRAQSCLDLQASVPGRAEPLWSVTRCSASATIPDLVDEVARGCVDALGRKRPPRYPYIGRVAGGAAMAASPLTAEAQRLMLEVDGARLAEIGRKLVAQFPTDPAAHVVRAWSLMLVWDAQPSPERLAALKTELDRLRTIDPNDPYGDVIQAYVYRSSGAPDEARQLYTRVLERKDLTPAAYSWVLRQRSFTFLQAGRKRAAREDAEEAVRLDPANGIALVALSKALEAVGDLSAALARAREAVALEPGSWRDLQRVGIAAMHAGSHDEAVEFLQRACDVSNNQEACANLAVELQRAGRETEALRAASRAEARPGRRWGAYNLACFWALRGDRKAALAALHRAFELGFADVVVMSDPDLQSLRGDPEFKADVRRVLERIRVRRSQATAAFPWQG